MLKQPDPAGKRNKLRKRAEERVGAGDFERPDSGGDVTEMQKLVHELQVHQVELEMQNDELRRTQLELEAARDRYAELYNFSPAGHLTLNGYGTIVEANYRATVLLGLNRTKLIGQPLIRFIDPDDHAAFHQHCRMTVSTGLRQSCDVRLNRKGDTSCHLHFESLAFREERQEPSQWRTAMLDISDRKQIERQFDIQKRQLEAIIESAMDAIVTVDERQRVVFFNKAAESMFQCSAPDAIGQSVERFIPERHRSIHQNHLRAFAAAAPASPSHSRVRALTGLRATGEEFPLEGSISRVTVEGGSLFTIILRDVTERKAAEDAVRAKETFTTAVLDSLSAMVCVIDKHGAILTTNESWKHFSLHNSPGMMNQGRIGDNYLEVCRQAIASGDRSVRPILDGIESVLRGERTTFSAEYACHSPTQQRWFLMRVTKLLGSEAVVISHIDMTDRVQMARALEDHVVLLAKQQRELESLARKLIEAQECERRRIARELHDDFNQRLAALALELETMERASAARSDPTVKQLAVVRSHVAQLSDDLHDLAYRLHPSLLEHVGLEVAVRDHIEQFAKRTGLVVQLTGRGMPEQLPVDVATNLFRIMQESLQNVFKHAAATKVAVNLSSSSRGIGLSVRDDGKGFDATGSSAQAKGLGLQSMQERMRLLGGFLRVHSLPAKGTKICAWVARGREDA